MQKTLLRLTTLVVLVLLGSTSLFAQFRLVGKFGRGQVQGRRAVVHVLVAVPPGAEENQAVSEALRRQGARPLESAEFTTTGLVWDEFSDSDPLNDFVVQYYNPSGDPTGNGEAVLLNTHATWRAVSASRFDFAYGGTTNRCPSLVQECSGPQTFDGFNDVGWLDLGRIHPFLGGTLAVTWFSTETDEADMAGNTRVNWSSIDAETVILHENGHVGGLGHSAIQQAVMYASYHGVQRNLHQDDRDGIAALYPAASSCTASEDPETSCSDGVDNDCNGFTDGDDLNCAPSCTPTESPEVSCSDGLDNDCDLFTDANDPDCVPSCTVTQNPETSCADGLDNDCDGNIDFDDSDCTGGGCSVGQVGDPCVSDSDCCSNKCRGKPGAKSCKG